MLCVNIAFNFFWGGDCVLEKGKCVVVKSPYFKGRVKFSRLLRRVAHDGSGWGGSLTDLDFF